MPEAAIVNSIIPVSVSVNAKDQSPSGLGRLIRGCVFNRGCWLLLILCWALVVSSSLYLTYQEIRRHNLELANAGARNMFNMVVLTRLWNASHRGVYVPVDEHIQPNPYLDHPRRDLKTTSGIDLTMINPAYMTRLIAEIAAQNRGVQFNITSLHPIRPANAADPWETLALRQFEQGVSEVSQLLDGKDGPEYRYMAPLPVVKACLKCHDDHGYEIGDIRGGISVSQPYEPFRAAAQRTFTLELFKHVGAFLLVSAAGWWLIHQLRRSWMDLEDNITELHKTRDKLVQSENLASLGRMVAGFAHEVNTPIGVAVGAISHGEEALNVMDRLIRQDEVSEEEIQGQLSVLRDSSTLAMSNINRAANLIRSFKRTSIDQVSEHARIFELCEIIDDVLLSMRNSLKKTGILIHVDCPAGLKINGHPGYYDQLLTNLLQNSLHHGYGDGARSGEIRIQVAIDQQGWLSMRYSDDGHGMDKQTLDKVFEPFFTTRRGKGSSGLGMYICHQLATARLGGEISCTSEPGQGCRFDIRIPAEWDDIAYPQSTDADGEA